MGDMTFCPGRHSLGGCHKAKEKKKNVIHYSTLIVFSITELYSQSIEMGIQL